MLSPKVLLISAVLLFMALGIKVSIPFATTQLSLLWSFFLTCLKPLYLYIIINTIIISIVASSMYHRPETTPPPLPAYKMTSPPSTRVRKVKPVLVEEQEEEEKAIDPGMPLMRMDSTEFPPEYPSPTEKPLISAKFGHRKTLKSNTEGGRALRVARPKRHETFENTWKTITEGRPMPLRRHMKKCNTWQNRGSTGPLESTPVTVEKSETFNDRTNQAEVSVSVPVSGGKLLRKEPSLSQDELNRRVEAFIKKFNHDMRLERQKSLNRLMQMNEMTD
ncbi:uncharacterized protein LOC133306709 [Gastrolobium bilobum]|uniref:uncharacterized protein LOC133306709 n=1 Tax=Gastrolobium bilobum TaxID=150636 RepID=UPI002AB14040|nr:uncharacterized protein LOC133306709 [Gastrolobium bilobum]